MDIRIYIGVSTKSPKKSQRKICYLLSCEKDGKEETRGGEPEEVTETYHGATVIAVSRALKRITGPCRVTIYAEDSWTMNMITTQMPAWAKNGFRDKKGKPMHLQQEWMQIWLTSKEHDLNTETGTHKFTEWMKERMEG
ncbi:hypothetical protein ACTQZS_12465 [Bilifractor sp. LCP19S3_H10]|uniref:hypothetical protein n=1 Tax=Bilifractor sp. LCP19S3_H10 TaxID=3438736 RepID=UPI003F926A42